MSIGFALGFVIQHQKYRTLKRGNVCPFFYFCKNTIMKEIDLALNLFDEGNSCAQAILGAYAQRVNIDSKVALKIGAGLGGGLGRKQHICGAVNAGAIIIGLKYSNGIAGDQESKGKVSEIVGNYVTECEKALGSVQCKELLKIDLTNPDERLAAKESGLLDKVCSNAVGQAAKILERYLEVDCSK
jgi:C_GCAxxG_C_C family probable redox protein